MIGEDLVSLVFERVRVLGEHEDFLVGVFGEDLTNEITEQLRLRIGFDPFCLLPECLDSPQFLVDLLSVERERDRFQGSLDARPLGVGERLGFGPVV